MSLNRRQFVVLSCVAAAGCASQSGTAETWPIRLRPVSIDAGAASNFSADGVYSQFVNQGFFVIRAPMIWLLCRPSARTAGANSAEPDHSFYCRCHGSTFDPVGHVTEGPATRDLPILPTTVDSRGHLMCLRWPSRHPAEGLSYCI